MVTFSELIKSIALFFNFRIFQSKLRYIHFTFFQSKFPCQLSKGRLAQDYQRKGGGTADYSLITLHIKILNSLHCAV